MYLTNKELVKSSIEYRTEIIEEVIKFEMNDDKKEEYYVVSHSNNTFEYKTYYCTKFLNLSFQNTKKKVEVIEGITFRYCRFSNCTFRNIEFLKCIFIGCFFEECEFGNNNQKIFFTECKFTGKSISSRMNALDIMSVVEMNCFIKNSRIFAYFQYNTDISSLIVENTDIFFMEIKDSNCNYVKIIESNINNCLIDSCLMKKFVVSDCKVLNFQIEDTNRITLFDFDTALVDIKPIDAFIYRKDNYSSRLFHTFANQFKKNKYEGKYGEYFYIAKGYEIKEARKFKKFRLILADKTCGFGEKPHNALISSFFLIIAFGFAYYFSGLKIDDEIISYRNLSNINDLCKMIRYFFNCMHFSIVTFTTVGYGNIIPVNMSKLFSSIEMLLGVVFIALYTSTLVRKMTR